MKKNNIAWFWNLYKWQILAIGVAAALGIYLLCAALTKKECVLSVMLLDCHADVSQEQAGRELAAVMRLDERRECVLVQNELMISDTNAGTNAESANARKSERIDCV